MVPPDAPRVQVFQYFNVDASGGAGKRPRACHVVSVWRAGLHLHAAERRVSYCV